MDRATAFEKQGSWHNLQHDGWPIHGSVPSFSSKPAIEAVGVKPPSIDVRLVAYWAHIIVCDRYVQYLLAGLNPLILNRHKRGLQSWRFRLSTYHSLTFSIDSLHFPPKGPARSQVIHPTITNLTREGINPKSREWEPPLDFYRELSSKHNMY
jgi:hypothetical protein